MNWHCIKHKWNERILCLHNPFDGPPKPALLVEEKEGVVFMYTSNLDQLPSYPHKKLGIRSPDAKVGLNGPLVCHIAMCCCMLGGVQGPCPGPTNDTFVITLFTKENRENDVSALLFNERVRRVKRGGGRGGIFLHKLTYLIRHFTRVD